MIKQLKLRLDPILSEKEIEVVLKRLNNKPLTQIESNYLSRSIRPKLRSAEFASSSELLRLLDYRRKKYERKNSVLKRKIMEAVKNRIDVNNIKAVVIFGSYVRNRHTNYRDIDMLVVLKKKLWSTEAEKYRIKISIEKNIDIETDIHLITYDNLIKLFPYSPLLQTELKECEVIYGGLKLKKKIIVNKPYLYSRLMEVEYIMELGKTTKPRYIYNAIRTCLSINLFLKKTVNNNLIIRKIENNIGKKTARDLLDDKANESQKDIALHYLKYLYHNLIKDLK